MGVEIWEDLLLSLSRDNRQTTIDLSKALFKELKLLTSIYLNWAEYISNAPYNDTGQLYRTVSPAIRFFIIPTTIYRNLRAATMKFIDVGGPPHLYIALHEGNRSQILVPSEEGIVRHKEDQYAYPNHATPVHFGRCWVWSSWEELEDEEYC